MDRTWIDRIIAATEWTAAERHSFDWAATEEQLGTRLPTDYKELAEVFGPGEFGEWVGLMLPIDTDTYGYNLLASWSSSRVLDMTRGASPWEPYGVYPKPGGLLEWGYTPDGHQTYYWVVEGDDPDRWPVVVGYEDEIVFDRYEYTTAEHVHRELVRVLSEYPQLRKFITHDELVAWRSPR